ncbi:MAG: hypothetical protein WD690_06525 [Vicinamibacterales bacterium]
MDHLNLSNDRDTTRNVWQESAATHLMDRLGSLGTSRALVVAGGATLAALGLRRRGVIGGLLTAVGSALLYRGLTGRDDLAAARAWSAETLRARGWQSPDDVDEAAKESFPASDPPSH